MLGSVPAVKAHHRLVDRREHEIVDAVDPRRLPNRMLGRLDLRLATRSAAKVLELDPTREGAGDRVRSAVRTQPSELQTEREDEDVRREAVAALM
jgi:hypothetical protein